MRLAVVAAIGISATGGAAQPVSSEAEYQDARTEMLEDLSDPESAFRFAEAAIAVGDIRGAIEALERILTINPNLTNIRLELGLLYLRAGSPDLAESYLSDVVAAPETPPDIRDRAEDLLEEGQLRLSKNVLSGSASVGLRYETNANAAPSEILIGGAPANILDPVDKAQPDASLAGGLELRHVFRLEGQQGHTIETDLDLFGARYQEVTSSDAGFAQVETGPRFRIGELGSATLRPYVGGSTLSLGGERYRDTGFVGLEGTHLVGQSTYLFGDVEARRNDFIDSDVNPFASRFTGEEYRASFRASRELRSDLIVSATVFGIIFDAKAAFESNDALGVDLAANWSFDNPFSDRLGDADIRASAAYTRINYREPNPIIDPDTTQVDDRWEFRAGLLAPFTDDLSLDVTLDYVNNLSNLPNDEFDNFRVSGGLRYDFRVIP